jgi:hypothetical protein
VISRSTLDSAVSAAATRRSLTVFARLAVTPTIVTVRVTTIRWPGEVGFVRNVILAAN